MKTLFASVFIFAVLISSIGAQIPDFSPNHDVVVCGPNNVYFVLTAPQDPQNIWWDFGDGETATGLTPAHYYSTTGVYDVKLVVEKNGVRDSIVKTAFVTVNPLPEARFERETQRVHQPFKRAFHFTGFSNADSIISYVWKVNDTTVATTQNLEYVFPRRDQFAVTLEITNNKGCSNSVTDSVYISGEEVETGIGEKFFQNDIMISLTSDQQQLFVERLSGVYEPLTLTLYDITGKVELTSLLQPGQKGSALDISGLYPGLHIINVSNRQYEAIKKIHKLRQ